MKTTKKKIDKKETLQEKFAKSPLIKKVVLFNQKIKGDAKSKSKSK